MARTRDGDHEFDETAPRGRWPEGRSFSTPPDGRQRTRLRCWTSDTTRLRSESLSVVPEDPVPPSPSVLSIPVLLFRSRVSPEYSPTNNNSAPDQRLLARRLDDTPRYRSPPEGVWWCATPDPRDAYLAAVHSPRYQVHGAPNCLVAAVLTGMGCSAGVLRELEYEAGHGRHRGHVGFGSSRHRRLQRFTPPARALLDSLQRHQDTGVTWRTAADRAGQPCTGATLAITAAAGRGYRRTRAGYPSGGRCLPATPTFRSTANRITDTPAHRGRCPPSSGQDSRRRRYGRGRSSGPCMYFPSVVAVSVLITRELL